MRFGDFSVKTKIMAQGVIPTLLLLVLALAAAQSLRALLDSVYWVDHTHKVIRDAMAIQDDAINMQTGMRGYLLTGQESFLDSYKQGAETINKRFESLKKTASGQERSNSLDETQKVIETWRKDVAEPAIALRREIGNAKDMQDMSELYRQGLSKKFYEKFSGQMKAFIEKEKNAFVQRQKEQARETDPVRLRSAIAAVDYTNMLIEQGLQILVASKEVQRAQLGYLLSGNKEFLDAYRTGSANMLGRVAQLTEAVADDDAQVKLLDGMVRMWKDWKTQVLEPETTLRKQIAESKTMADMKAYVAKGEDKKYFDKFKELISAFETRENALMGERQKAADATAAFTQKILYVGTFCIFVASLVISFVLAGTLTRPLLEAMGLAESISNGDLTQRLKVQNRDEVGRLGAALNKMGESLRLQIRRSLEVVNVLAASASEISATVSQLAASTSRTSSAVTEATTTVEELKQAARVSSDQAKNVADAAHQAVQVSESGRQATEDTVNRMRVIRNQMESIGETVVKLSEHSQAIENIIGSVQDIADQSNLLAVNASIEAARAGDQGKGFAVVAHEIKTLADQSRESTQQVRSILEETRKWVSAVVMATEQGGKAVDAGVEQSSLAGQSIQSLSGNVVVSSQAAALIDASAQQQFVGVEQVASAMTNIEQAMRQNLDGTTQLEQAAHKLQELGDSLKHIVERYRV